MFRPARIFIDEHALLHNVKKIRHLAPGKQLIAMVKANAYGCGLNKVIPTLEGHVDAFGVASLDEALAVRALGARTQCVLFQGFFAQEELPIIAMQNIAMVLYNTKQLNHLLKTTLEKPISVWVKVNTGMNRLGFQPSEVKGVIRALVDCAWVNKDIGLMTHLACPDEPLRDENKHQVDLFNTISEPGVTRKSIVNSAGILAFPDWHCEVVRPGILLYGISPFSEKTGSELALKPVVRFTSKLISIYPIKALASVGYGGSFTSNRDTVLGVVAVGYGDGYPRHITSNTPVWIKGREYPIVGRVSMDMITVDLTDNPSVAVGDEVELWGKNLPIERIAQCASTIAYELLCQITSRVRTS